MSFERAMLHYLYTHQNDYSGALLELPPKLLSLFVSAFQSYLFNCALSQRFDDGHTLTEPLVGDRLIFANGRTDIVTATNSNAVSLHIRRGRCSIALFMPAKILLKQRVKGSSQSWHFLKNMLLPQKISEGISVCPYKIRWCMATNRIKNEYRIIP